MICKTFEFYAELGSHKTLKPHISRFQKWNCPDKGSVESALVIIPTMMLFLGVLQISGFFLFQTGFSIFTQSQVARASLIGSTENIDQLETQSVDLPGGGSILVGNRSANPPRVTPLLIAQNEVSSTGIAVRER